MATFQSFIKGHGVKVGALILLLVLPLCAQEKARLDAEIVVQVLSVVQKDLGITKYYQLFLVNHTGVTQFVNQCEFTDDAMDKTVAIPLALQRWNEVAKRWDTVEAGLRGDCNGGGGVQARPLKTSVAPGQKVGVGGDFAGANDGFSFGDRCRYVVFLSSMGDFSDAAISPEFVLDEHRSKPAPASPASGTNLQTPVLLSPADGKVFDSYPRDTTLRWQPVAGAASYVVQVDIEYVDSAQPHYWASDKGIGYRQETTTDTDFRFEFGGAQPGRWRVWAVDAEGHEGPKSAWNTFRYTK